MGEEWSHTSFVACSLQGAPVQTSRINSGNLSIENIAVLACPTSSFPLSTLPDFQFREYVLPIYVGLGTLNQGPWLKWSQSVLSTIEWSDIAVTAGEPSDDCLGIPASWISELNLGSFLSFLQSCPLAFLWSLQGTQTILLPAPQNTHIHIHTHAESERERERKILTDTFLSLCF